MSDGPEANLWKSNRTMPVTSRRKVNAASFDVYLTETDVFQPDCHSIQREQAYPYGRGCGRSTGFCGRDIISKDALDLENKKRTYARLVVGRTHIRWPKTQNLRLLQPLNRSGRAYLRSSDQAALDQPIGYQLFPMQVGIANPRKNGCDQSDCQGWRERQSSRR